ncbi:MAG: response regulator, partial [Chloroflexi bacterium]
MTQSQSSATILVVDDDSGIREALTDILEDEGYAVRSACDGQAALDLLRQQAEPPALVLLDLMMPRMNGWQFRSEQRRDPALANIPVVVISAS